MNSERRIPVAVGCPANLGGIIQQHELSCAQLGKLLRWAHAQPQPFSFTEFEEADQDKRDQLKRSGWYVCGHFREDHRSTGNLISSTAVVLDCDKPGVTRETLLTALDRLGCAYIAATSTSHGIDGQARYRVVLPLDKPASPEQYKALWAHLATKVPGADPGAKDSVRANYLPKVPRGAHGHEVIVCDDRPWLAALPPAPAEAPAPQAFAKLAALPGQGNLTVVRAPPPLHELLTTLVEYAEFDICGHADWVEVGQIIHHATNGSEEGLGAYIDYSRCLSNFDEGEFAGDEGCRRKWRTFGRGDHKPVTYATLCYRLKQLQEKAAEKKNDRAANEASVTNLKGEGRHEQARAVEELMAAGRAIDAAARQKLRINQVPREKDGDD